MPMMLAAKLWFASRLWFASKLCLASNRFLSMLVVMPALMLSALPMSARADPSTNASFVIEELRYELTDLDPDDGITPTLTFVIDPNVRQANTIARIFGHFGEIARDYSPWLPAATPSTSSLSFPFGSVNASLTGTLGSDLSLQGRAILTANDGVERSMSTRADSGELAFVLSPMSALTFHVDVTMHAATVLPSAGAVGGDARVETSMTVYPQTVPGSAPLRSYEVLRAAAGESLDFQDTFALTVYNNLTSEADSVLVLNGYGSIAGAVSPVPEPASWALLLGGVAAIGMVGRRRVPTRLRSARSR